MSLYTIVSRGIRRPADQPTRTPTRTLPIQAQLRRVERIDAMSILETALALSAIGTAVLLGLAR